MRERRQIFEEQNKFLSGIGVPEKSEFVPDYFQLEAIQSLVAGNDTLVVAPTGAGKTFIATEAIKSFIRQGKRAVYTTPLKALSNAKYAEFKKIFEPEFSVGLLTGDRKIEGGAHVVIATTEIYRNELYDYCENYSLVILDEFHYLSDQQRGPVWEESIILSPPNSTILMLSASISNHKEISSWIEYVRNKKCMIVCVSKRPVELRLGFLHPQYGAIPLEDELGNINQEVLSFYQSDTKFSHSQGQERGGRRIANKKNRGGRGRRR